MMTDDLQDALDTRYGESDKVGVRDRDDYYHVSFGEYGYRIRSEDEGYTLTIAPHHDNLDWEIVSEHLPQTFPEILIRAENEILLSAIELRKSFIEEAEDGIQSIQQVDRDE